MPIVNNSVNAVAMTVLPDAPSDPATGLRVPTIAVATGGGLSVIQHDGTVRNGSIAQEHRDVILTPSMMAALRYATGFWHFYLNPGRLGAGFSPSFSSANGQYYYKKFHAANATRLLGRSYTGELGIFGQYLRHDNIARGLIYRINSTFNTGWMTGDIRRCFLSDTEVGSVTGPELVTNGTFDTDTTGWTPSTANVTATRNASGQLEVTNNGAGWVTQTINTIAGRTYRLEVNWSQKQGSGRFNIGTTVGGSSPVSLVNSGNYTGGNAFTFVASATTTFISLADAGGGAGTVQIYDNISVREVVADRSYKVKGALIEGAITCSQLASGTSLVGYSGFSAANYLREPYSADLDFGTGEWSCSAWVNVPTTLPANSFPVIGSNLYTGQTPNISNANGSAATWDAATSTATVTANGAGYPFLEFNLGLSTSRAYEVEVQLTSASAITWTNVSIWLGWTNGPSLNSSGYAKFLIMPANNAVFFIRVGSIGTTPYAIKVQTLSVREVGVARVADRAHSSGAYVNLGVNGVGRIVATAFDGATTRTVITSNAYNNATWLKAEACYTVDGSLSIRVNGREVAVTRGNPLVSVNNTSAVLTIGNSFALDAPFPGSIALLKLGATVPTYDQSLFMYEQEKQMFRAGAQTVLPDANSIIDMAYDDATDRWVAISSSNESYWTGLVRNTVTPVPAGSYSKVAATSGVELIARATTLPGVDVTMPPLGLRKELIKRAEAAAKASRELSAYDFVGGFTATTVSGNTAITSVANLSYPTSYIGARISGSGIPANTTIVAVSGTTIYLSAAATASASGVSISFLDFALPVGMTAKTVISAGVIQQEGATKSFVRLWDGFYETIRFAVAPGATAWVQIQATRDAAQ